MRNIDELLTENRKKIIIVGHVHPDGDCIGATTALYRYLLRNHPELSVDLYLEEFVDSFSYLAEDITVRSDDGENERYDFGIALDVSNEERIGAGKSGYLHASTKFSFDHHETNTGFADETFNLPEASSCSEILYSWLTEEKIDRETATALYTGIIHDTGVFRYSCTSPDTLRVTAKLLEKGVDFPEIIRNTVTEEDFAVVKITAEIISGMELIKEEEFAYSVATTSLQKKYGLTPLELGSVVTDMNIVRNVSVMLFLYQVSEDRWKGSLRSNQDVNVAKIAEKFGGGGHARAAGFTFDGNVDDVVSKIRFLVAEQRK